MLRRSFLKAATAALAGLGIIKPKADGLTTEPYVDRSPCDGRPMVTMTIGESLERIQIANLNGTGTWILPDGRIATMRWDGNDRFELSGATRIS